MTKYVQFIENVLNLLIFQSNTINSNTGIDIKLNVCKDDNELITFHGYTFSLDVINRLQNDKRYVSRIHLYDKAFTKSVPYDLDDSLEGGDLINCLHDLYREVLQEYICALVHIYVDKSSKASLDFSIESNVDNLPLEEFRDILYTSHCSYIHQEPGQGFDSTEKIGKNYQPFRLNYAYNHMHEKHPRLSIDPISSVDVHIDNTLETTSNIFPRYSPIIVENGISDTGLLRLLLSIFYHIINNNKSLRFFSNDVENGHKTSVKPINIDLSYFISQNTFNHSFTLSTNPNARLGGAVSTVPCLTSFSYHNIKTEDTSKMLSCNDIEKYIPKDKFDMLLNKPEDNPLLQTLFKEKIQKLSGKDDINIHFHNRDNNVKVYDVFCGGGSFSCLYDYLVDLFELTIQSNLLSLIFDYSEECGKKFIENLVENTFDKSLPMSTSENPLHIVSSKILAPLFEQDCLESMIARMDNEYERYNTDGIGLMLDYYQTINCSYSFLALTQQLAGFEVSKLIKKWSETLMFNGYSMDDLAGGNEQLKLNLTVLYGLLTYQPLKHYNFKFKIEENEPSLDPKVYYHNSKYWSYISFTSKYHQRKIKYLSTRQVTSGK